MSADSLVFFGEMHEKGSMKLLQFPNRTSVAFEWEMAVIPFNKPYLSTEEVSQMFGFSARTITEWASAWQESGGTEGIPAFKMGRSWRFDRLKLLAEVFDRIKVARNKALFTAGSRRVFGRGGSTAKSLRVGLYARVSTHDQQTLPMQLEAMSTYAEHRGWIVTTEIKDIGSGSIQRPKRELLMKAARRREIDAVLVWRLDRWGRSVADLVLTLKELNELGVAFVSLTEALDLTTPTGRAMAGLLAVFAEFEREVLRERVRTGIAQARKEGKQHGRPRSAARKQDEVKELFGKGLSKTEIARRLKIGRTSVRRMLGDKAVVRNDGSTNRQSTETS